MKPLVFSPRGMALRAVLILAAFLVFHLLGFRDYTCVFCGTSPSGDPNDQGAILLGIIYVFLYFSAVVGAPVLLLGSAILTLLLHRFGGASGPAPMGPPGLHHRGAGGPLPASCGSGESNAPSPVTTSGGST